MSVSGVAPSTAPTRNGPQRPSYAVTGDSEAIGKALAEQGVLARDLADKVQSARAELDRLTAELAEAEADAALGDRDRLDHARKASERARKTLSALEQQHETAERTLARLQNRHREALRRELHEQQDALAVAYAEAHGVLMEMFPTWSAAWSRLRSLREQDAACRRRLMKLDAPDGTAPYISPMAARGLRLVTRHPEERPLTEADIERLTRLLDNLALQDPPRERPTQLP